ncbi:MAG: FAD-dependent oxidoreductase, partial [Bacteroidetes bacterium]|nr:FAD-dependent oxidoreductase [Bacteroidota bacterium]
EVLCEGACVYNHEDVKPIEIGRLQAYVTNEVIEKKTKLFILPKSNGKKIAVIGAGPAGISCACELRMYGYEVDIFEAKERPSGLTISGVAPYKITNEAVMREMDYLEEQFGYTVKYNQRIGSLEELQKLEEDYDAIFIGIGLVETSELGIAGEDLKNYYGAIDFIERLRMNHEKVDIGKKVIVIGGGNTAMDVASESARMGADEVILAYRRSKSEIKGFEFEFDLAKSVGVKGMFNVAPQKIIGNGKVEGVEFIKTKSDKGNIETIEGSEFVESCDMVIRATGQTKFTDLLKQIPNLKLDDKNRILISEENFQTGNPFYFSAGDAVNGGVEVVNAVAEAKVAATGIHKYLSKK